MTLVLGGARSGKSRYAEELIVRHAAPWIYIATAQAFDDEMRARIAEHQARRHNQGSNNQGRNDQARNDHWRTIEAPLDLPGAIAQEPARPILVDCLTLWLTTLVLGGHDIQAATSALEAVLDSRQTPIVLVSNEVGLGIVPETRLGRSFRDDAGRLNQRMAARARHVLFMIAGLPMTLK
ncbi:MAG: bifunctional adenosylcobinamide kinase/adenosylcobinamide-phosphate guanylyltransferase [Rhodopila sp.]|nr:bifunctional adenosylcobinamide kinase/adenosylcobinamide-phosphate guanylyltransferase [Rhodopila sp.]